MVKVCSLPQVGLLVAGEEAVKASLQPQEGLIVRAGIPALEWKDSAGRLCCEFFCSWGEVLPRAEELGLRRVWEVSQFVPGLLSR
jgi:hypothetical protein